VPFFPSFTFGKNAVTLDRFMVWFLLLPTQDVPPDLFHLVFFRCAARSYFLAFAGHGRDFWSPARVLRFALLQVDTRFRSTPHLPGWALRGRRTRHARSIGFLFLTSTVLNTFTPPPPLSASSFDPTTRAAPVTHVGSGSAPLTLRLYVPTLFEEFR